MSTVSARAVDVLVVGAGPTGLTLALQAHDHGARVRLVERREAPFRPSRALIVHPRTLEVLRPLGVTDDILARSDSSPAATLHLGSHSVRARLGELALADTPFPHLTLVRQMDVEEVLAAALAARGVAIERATELVALRDDGPQPRDDDTATSDDGRTLRRPHPVRATLQGPAGTEEVDGAFVVGCDGPASTVRALCGISWRGRPCREEVVLADVELAGDLEPGAAHVVAGRRGLLFVFPLGERATWRVLATRPAGADPLPFGQPGPPAGLDEIQELLDVGGLDARVADLAWSARVRLQHRVAGRFRQGRVLLAGDAAHAHSPAAAQGMNTGIQDAANLGWKLAFAATGQASEALLRSYELERRRVARRVVASTRLVFWAEASLGPVPTFLRGVVAPLAAPILPLLLGRRRLVAEGVRVLSQLRVGYRHSPLSVSGTPAPRRGVPRAGARLGDEEVTAGGRRVRLHELLARPGVHVLVQRDAGDVPTDLSSFVHVHRLETTPGRGLVAIRPDGYVGFRCGTADVDQLRRWLASVGLPVVHSVPEITAVGDRRADAG